MNRTSILALRRRQTSFPGRGTLIERAHHLIAPCTRVPGLLRHPGQRNDRVYPGGRSPRDTFGDPHPCLLVSNG